MTDYLTVDGVRLECVSIGRPGGGLPSLVLLHEGLGCVEMWRDFPGRLHAESGRHVFAYSRQGYGRSDPKPAPWSLEYMHEEALEVLPRVLTEAGLDDVVLVGHSDGASIALIYAGGVAEQAATGLVLMAPHVFNEPVCVESIEQARALFLGSDLRIRLERYHGANVDHAFWGWNRAWLDPGFLGWNIERYLHSVTVPTLLIQGEQDQYGTPKQIDAIERGIAAPVQCEMLPACRHAPYVDQPRAVLRSICEFLKGAG
jgi:pimeloyl-ACP methyl ester carboxylesterase